MKRKFVCGIAAFCLALSVAGCGKGSEERQAANYYQNEPGLDKEQAEEVKLQDLDYTILGEEMVPAELASMLEERKADAFKMSYLDNQNLYICVGYGQQETGGYSITVDELYLKEEAVFVQTTLLGPDASEKNNEMPSYPYIVIKTEYLELPVICK